MGKFVPGGTGAGVVIAAPVAAPVKSRRETKRPTSTSYTMDQGVYGEGEFYCVRCKARRGIRLVKQEISRSTKAHAPAISGLCSHCAGKIHAFVNSSVFDQVGTFVHTAGSAHSEGLHSDTLHMQKI